MESNSIQMPASAGHALAYTIGPIFKHIIDPIMPLEMSRFGCVGFSVYVRVFCVPNATILLVYIQSIIS